VLRRFGCNVHGTHITEFVVWRDKRLASQDTIDTRRHDLDAVILAVCCTTPARFPHLPLCLCTCTVCVRLGLGARSQHALGRTAEPFELPDGIAIMPRHMLQHFGSGGQLVCQQWGLVGASGLV
jgi:hypothetical protein